MSFDANHTSRLYAHRELIGNDENAFDSVGHDIPTGTLMRWPFPQYHTDADSMEITSRQSIEEVIDFVFRVIDIIENDQVIIAKFVGLPSLANPEINLYLSIENVSGLISDATDQLDHLSEGLNQTEYQYLKANPDNLNKLMQNILRMADGQHTLLEIAEKSRVPFAFVKRYAEKLKEKSLIDMSVR
jgi:aminopeptidase-like protein